MMFTLGAAVKATVVPVGKNYNYNGIRHDDHDVVSAFLIAPILKPAELMSVESEAEGEVASAHSSPQRSRSSPAASPRSVSPTSPASRLRSKRPRSPQPPEGASASQPSVSGAASQRADGAEESSGAESIPTNLPSHWEYKSGSSCHSGEEGPEVEASELDEELRRIQDDCLEDNPAAAEAIGRILFKKKVVGVAGVMMVEVEPVEATIEALRHLLKVRNTYLQGMGFRHSTGTATRQSFKTQIEVKC